MPRLAKIAAIVLTLIGAALALYAWNIGTRPAAQVVPSQPPVAEATYDVVTTSAAVLAGQPITAEQLQVVKFPVNLPDAFRTVDAVVGKVAVFDLGPGTPVLKPQLAVGLATRIAEGERAIAIKVEESSAAGHRIRPGDYVDIFMLVRRENGGEIDRSQARLLLARKRVLAYGASSLDSLPDTPQADGNGNASAQQQPPRNEIPRTAVLAIPVAEINRLALGEAHGRLTLALRNPSDRAEPDPALLAELPSAVAPARQKAVARGPGGPLSPLDNAQGGVALADLVAGGGAPIAAARAAPAASTPAFAPAARPSGTSARASDGVAVEYIRGAKRETVRY